MPERGNRFRSEKNRVATVLGLVLAVAMAMTAAVPGLALADVNVLSGPPGGGQDGADGNEDWDCKRRTGYPSPVSGVEVPLTTRAEAVVCITEYTSTGCKVSASAWVNNAEEAGTTHSYFLRLDLDTSYRESGSMPATQLYRTADLTEDAEIPYGTGIRAKATIGSYAAGVYVWSAYAEASLPCN